MNEHIRRLAGQALDRAVPQTWTTLTADDLNKFTEVFAELIINRIIDNVQCHGDLYDSPDIKFICENIVNSVKFDLGAKDERTI